MRNAKLGELLRTVTMTTKYRGLVTTQTEDNTTLAGLQRSLDRGVTIEDISFGYRNVTRVCVECEAVEIPDAQWITKCTKCFNK